MTKEEILAMSAGRELDELIAEKVFGYREIAVDDVLGKIFTFKLGDKFPSDNYSTDVATAWEVVEKMRENKIGFIINDTSCSPNFAYRGRFYNPTFDIHKWVNNPNDDYTVWENSVQLLICKAAILATLDK